MKSVDKDHGRSQSKQFQRENKSVIVFPIMVDKKPIGVITLDYKKIAGFDNLKTEMLNKFNAAVYEKLVSNRPTDQALSETKLELYSLDKELQYPVAEDELVQAVQPQIVDATSFLIEKLRRRPEDVYSLPPRRFEELIANLIRDKGWEVHLTGATRDGGRDMLAYLDTRLGRLLCLVEAKRYSPNRPVGVDLVRNLFGTLCHEEANSAMIVTTSRFTVDARRFQAKHKFLLHLKDYQDLIRWLSEYGKEIVQLPAKNIDLL